MVLLSLVVSTLLCGALCAAVAMGIGALLQKAFRIEPRPLEGFWFGLAAITALLETYHLFRRVDAAIGLALLAAGVLSFFGFRVASRLGKEIRSASRWTCLIYAAAVALIAVRAANPCRFFDTGLYGAQTIRWLVTYPAVPGLANLQGRFGFNSSVFLCMALFSHGVLATLTYRVFDGLVLAALLAPVVAASVRIFSCESTRVDSGRGQSSSAENWFAAIMILPLLYRIFESSIIEDLVGTDTDLPAMVVALAALAYLFSALQTDASGDGRAAIRSKLLCADALFGLAAVFKLSMVMLAGAGWLVGFITWLSLKPEDRARAPERWPAWATYVFVPAAIVIPWLVHGAILSGYFLYPSTLFPLPVNWRVPSASVQLEEAGVRAWARMPHGTLSQAAGIHWLAGWLHGNGRDRAELVFPVLIIGLGLLLVLWGSRNSGSANRALSRHNDAGSWAGLWLLIPTTLGLVFWFVQAPALRFAQAPLWGTACVLGGYGISRWLENRAGEGRYVLLAILLATGWSLYPRTLWQRSFAPLLDVRQLSPLPPPDVTPLETRYGVKVFVARTGGQDWDADLPASDYLNPTLRLRRPGDLAAGFASDGLPPDAEWQASTLAIRNGVYGCTWRGRGPDALVLPPADSSPADLLE